jgi:hypothetical protein
LTSSIPGIFSASIDGSTVIDISETDGTVLLGQTVSTLNISAYAFSPGQDPYVGASCQVSAQASIPWVTKYDCFSDTVYFIPKLGGKASITNRLNSGISSSIIDLQCNPGIVSTSFQADASSGPASPFSLVDREDGYNLVYNGTPISISSGVPQKYSISLGFVGTIEGYLQSFSFQVNPPEPAKVQYSFVFSGVVL